MISTVWDVAASAPWSFLIGAAVGFVLASRFRIVRAKPPEDNDKEEK